jgi:hypothetical protein
VRQTACADQLCLCGSDYENPASACSGKLVTGFLYMWFSVSLSQIAQEMN